MTDKKAINALDPEANPEEGDLLYLRKGGGSNVDRRVELPADSVLRRSVGADPDQIPDNEILDTRRELRERIERDATLNLKFAENTYSIYEGLADGNTEKPYADIVTHTRASDGTGFNALRNLETVTDDVQRLVYSPETGRSQGLLVEGESTNQFLNNEDPETQDITLDSGTYTLSFYGTGEITLSGGANGTLEGTGGDTDRVELTFEADGNAVTFTVSGDPVLPQVEEGESATSPIITTGTPATRAADVVSQEEGDKWITPTAGTLIVKFLSFGGLNGIQRGLFITDDSSFTESFGFNFNNNQIIFAANSGGVSVTSDAADLPVGFSTFLVSFEENGEFTFVANGQVVDAGAFPDFTSARGLSIGSRGGLDTLRRGAFSQISWVPYTVSQAEAIAITQPGADE